MVMRITCAAGLAIIIATLADSDVRARGPQEASRAMAKMQEVQETLQHRPKDAVPPIGVMLMMRRAQAAMEAGDPARAENLADQALAIAEGKRMHPAEVKLRKVKTRMDSVAKIMSQFESKLQAGDEKGLEALLDEALAALEGRSKAK